MDTNAMAEAISAQWHHIKRTLVLADDEFEPEGDGQFTVREGRVIAIFNGVTYTLNPADGSVLVIWDQDGRSCGRTYAPDGSVLEEHELPGPTAPSLN